MALILLDPMSNYNSSRALSAIFVQVYFVYSRSRHVWKTRRTVRHYVQVKLINYLLVSSIRSANVCIAL